MPVAIIAGASKGLGRAGPGSGARRPGCAAPAHPGRRAAGQAGGAAFTELPLLLRAGDLLVVSTSAMLAAAVDGGRARARGG
ncbi:hypothetical protein GTY56_21565, partial [Streptomyces sp. SID5643]|nr:hypothetical protein [Streptomyces sp. SID5643]